MQCRALQCFVSVCCLSLVSACESTHVDRQARATSQGDEIARKAEIARLEAELSRGIDDYNRRKEAKRRFVEYERDWRAKVESVGNANYPAEARGRIHGWLRLSVSIKPDGAVDKIKIERSSGYDVLDRAAVRIVELASPFAPFSPDIRRDTDVLVITRTWTFGPTDRLETQ
jgi:protein TonB